MSIYWTKSKFNTFKCQSDPNIIIDVRSTAADPFESLVDLTGNRSSLSFWLILFSSFYLELSRGGGERIWIACDFVFRLVGCFVRSFVRSLFPWLSLGGWVVGSLGVPIKCHGSCLPFCAYSFGLLKNLLRF